MRDRDHRAHFLTDEYETRLAEIVSDYPEVTLEQARNSYLQYCTELRRFLRDDAPIDLIRRIAFRKTERAIQKERT